MPIRKVKGGWRFGHSGLYKTLGAAKRSYNAYLAKKHSTKPSAKSGAKSKRKS
jgi:hypothetical protein